MKKNDIKYKSYRTLKKKVGKHKDQEALNQEKLQHINFQLMRVAQSIRHIFGRS